MSPHSSQEVSEAKSLLEQTTLVCQGRPFYQSVLQYIKKSEEPLFLFEKEHVWTILRGWVAAVVESYIARGLFQRRGRYAILQIGREASVPCSLSQSTRLALCTVVRLLRVTLVPSVRLVAVM